MSNMSHGVVCQCLYCQENVILLMRPPRLRTPLLSVVMAVAPSQALLPFVPAGMVMWLLSPNSRNTLDTLLGLGVFAVSITLVVGLIIYLSEEYDHD